MQLLYRTPFFMPETAKSPVKILITDDEPNIVTAIDFLLKRAGYATAQAFNGRQALQMCASFLPDILILDVMMPDLDGFEVARQVRDNPLYEGIKILFLTARGTQKDKEAGYAYGADYYLIKPFDNDELVSLVNEMVEYE